MAGIRYSLMVKYFDGGDDWIIRIRG